jgi:hypothetical protein
MAASFIRDAQITMQFLELTGWAGLSTDPQGNPWQMFANLKQTLSESGFDNVQAVCIVFDNV